MSPRPPLSYVVGSQQFVANPTAFVYGEQAINVNEAKYSMPDRKNSVILRILIVVVAVFLGFSLNMFQFRDSFRTLVTKGDRRAMHVEETQLDNSAPVAQLPVPKSSIPPGSQTQPVTPSQGDVPQAPQVADDSAETPTGQSGAKPAADESARTPATDQATGQSSDPGTGGERGAGQAAGPSFNSGTGVEHGAGQAKGETSSAGDAASASVPDAVASAPDAAPTESMEIAVLRHQPKTPSAPVVVTDDDSAKAAGIGRRVPVGSAPEQATENTRDESPKPEEPVAAQESETSRAEAQQDDAGTAVRAAHMFPPGTRTLDGKPVGPAPHRQETPSTDAAPPASSAIPMESAPVSPQAPAPTPPSESTPTSAPAASGHPVGTPPTGTEQKQVGETKTNRLQTIRFAETPETFEMTVLTQTPVETTRSFHSTSPARLVVDLPGSWQSGVAASIACKSELMARVRVGVHPDKVRLVLDYKDQDAQDFAEPIIEKRPTGLVITVSKAGKKE